MTMGSQNPKASDMTITLLTLGTDYKIYTRETTKNWDKFTKNNPDITIVIQSKSVFFYFDKDGKHLQ